jgi:hypothetical protein
VKPSTKSRNSRQKLPSRPSVVPWPISRTILHQIERDHSRCKANFCRSKMQETVAATVDGDERYGAPKSGEKHTCPLGSLNRPAVTRRRFSPGILNQTPRNKSHSTDNLLTYIMEEISGETVDGVERRKLAKSRQKHMPEQDRGRGQPTRGAESERWGKRRFSPLDIAGSDG